MDETYRIAIVVDVPAEDARAAYRAVIKAMVSAELDYPNIEWETCDEDWYMPDGTEMTHEQIVEARR